MTATIWTAVAVAQPLTAAPTQQAAPRLSFSLSSTLASDDNRSLSSTNPDPGTTLDSRLGFVFNSQTLLDQLQLSGSGLLRFGPRGNTFRSGAQQPNLQFSYKRDTGNARLSATASYVQSDVNLLEAFTLPDGTASTLPQAGTVTNSTLALNLETGVNDPLGFILSSSARNVTYSDTTDPNVYDSRTRSASLTTRLTFSPRTTADLILSYSGETDLNSTNTKRSANSLGVKLTQDISSALQLQAEIGYSRASTDQTTLSFSQVSAGLFGQATLTRQMVNGIASVGLQSERDSLGSRNSLHFGRKLAFADGGALEADLGVEARPGSSAQAIGSLTYRTKFAGDSLNASLVRSVALNADNVDVAYTRIGLQYTHPINTRANIGLSGSLGQAGGAGFGTVTDQTLTTLRATYSYGLTQDWSLDTGYQYRHATNATTRSASSNMVFVTIGRKFIALP